MAKKLQHLKVVGLVLLLAFGSLSMAAKPDTQPGNASGGVSAQGFIFNR